MKLASKLAIAAMAVIGGSLAATSASASIVCNAEGWCWHVAGAPPAYHPEWGISVHEDTWRWSTHDHYTWHEHEGRGYWHGGKWVTF